MRALRLRQAKRTDSRACHRGLVGHEDTATKGGSEGEEAVQDGKGLRVEYLDVRASPGADSGDNLCQPVLVADWLGSGS